MKKIISILLILLALSLTLGAVSAEEVASDDVLAAEDTAAVSADESESAATPTTGSSEVAANATTDTAEADLAVDVEVVSEEDDGEIIWGVLVTNYGPDTAVNAMALVNGPDSLELYEYLASTGTFDPTTCIWQIGDLAKDAKAILSGFGMHCFSCPMSQMETIEEAAMVHGVDADLMLEKLNEKKEVKRCGKIKIDKNKK